jgi:Outer membrane cobalamin receptor protein
MRLKVAYVTIVCMFSGTMAIAQNNNNELDPVTISSSLTENRSSQTGRNIFIINGNKFNSLPIHSVDELLRYMPGVEVQSRGPLGAQSDISIRGGTFQQVLVILDGIRLNDPNTGHFTSYIPISPEEIDRIEILKGASSAVYGSEAVGGVINIITKSFAAHKTDQSFDLNAQATGGQYDLYALNAGGTYANRGNVFSGGILTNNTSGQPQRGTNGFVNATTASLSFGHYFSNNWQLSLRSAYDSRKFSAQNFYTNFVSDTANEQVKTFWNQLQISHSTNKDKLSLEVGYKNLKDHYAFSSQVPANENTSNLIQALVTDEWKINNATTIVSGLQFINKKIESNDRGNHHVDQAAGFIIVNEQVTPNFLLIPALRLEWNERSGWDLVPQLHLSYHVSKFQIRGGAGKTIRDADFTERFNNYNKTVVKSGSIGNPDLVSEHSFSYEIGVDYFAAQRFRISSTFFQERFSNLIDFVNTAYADMPRKDNLLSTGTYALAKNIDKVNTTGVETDLLYTFNLKDGQQLWSTLGITWLESIGNNGTPSFYVSSHANWLINFNIHYQYHWVGFSLNGIYKERNALPASAPIASVSHDYFVVNGKLEGYIIPQKLNVFIEADNIGDIKYTDLLGSQMPGRWLMGGFKISLSK